MPTPSQRAVVRSRAEPNRFARELFDGLPRRYDVLEEVLSFGQNRRWRTAMVDAVVAGNPATVLDVATGTAGVALALADRTNARVVGVDLTEQMLRRGRQRVEARGRDDRIRLAAARAEQLPFRDASFDALTFTYLLRYVADPAATLAELARVVRPGGVVASLEFGVPPPPVWRPAWRLYTRAILPVAGLVSGGGAWARVGSFLGPSIEQHYRAHPVERHVAMWQAAGLENVRVRPMSLGGGLVMSGRRRHG
ncbi:bifunctional demethylmenaquinone methyltransferase/2-methoxy-6-polyprenyl-1,4-benzoquinol methylase UbiE [Nocardioides koreensis]|uniref:Bifunctional demethylmenaquinone methyltransferase/2-methoxy-6-polyprenyl-1,4-benzoquinol methylase UbiE n=1 Tax=Nocardioides koreensis TaxID=433651 RepID=A0ABP5LDT7_9ACTN